MPVDPRSIEATTREGRVQGLIADLLRRLSYLERFTALPRVVAHRDSPGGTLITTVSDVITFPLAGKYIMRFGATGFSPMGGANAFYARLNGTNVGQALKYVNTINSHEFYGTEIVLTVTAASAQTLTFVLAGTLMIDTNDTWYYTIERF